MAKNVKHLIFSIAKIHQSYLNVSLSRHYTNRESESNSSTVASTSLSLTIQLHHALILSFCLSTIVEVAKLWQCCHITKYNQMPYRHQSYYFPLSDKCIFLFIFYPTLFISLDNLHHCQSYRFSKYLNKILQNSCDQNNSWCRVVINFQNTEIHVQSCASS